MDEWEAAKNIALRRAFELRRQLSFSRDTPLNVFDVCARLGLDVRFLDCKSLEGMYCRDPRCCIFLPSLTHRPRGRVSFTCAHELGHHRLGHGTRVDEYLADSDQRQPRNPEEYAANVFAAHLLTPRQAVISAFERRRLCLDNLLPAEVLLVAGELGVGYRTLLTQMTFSLHMLEKFRFEELAKTSPKSVRASIWPDSAETDLLNVDEGWGDVPVDLQIGEFAMIPSRWRCVDDRLEHVAEVDGRAVWVAVATGKCELIRPEGEVSVRITRRGYVGPYSNCYRSEVDA